jgi:hypothetical protein
VLFYIYRAIIVILFICIGFSKELWYTGYHLTNLTEGSHFKVVGPINSFIISVMLSLLLFGIFYMGSPNASFTNTTNITAWGVLFSVPYILTGNQEIPMG